MINKSKVKQVLEKKLADQETKIQVLQAKLDALEADYEGKSKEYSTLSAKSKEMDAKLRTLHDKMDATTKKTAELTRVFHDDIKQSDKHVLQLEEILDTIDGDRDKIQNELSLVVNDFTAMITEKMATVQDASAKLASSMAKNIQAQSPDDLEIMVRKNPGAIMVLVDENDRIQILDNRAINTQIANDVAANMAEMALQPFRFFKQLSPIKSNHRNEVYSIESLLDIIQGYSRWNEQVPHGLIVERKYKGIKVQIHKKGNDLVCWTSRRVDVSNNIPSIIGSLRSMEHDFILEGEIELYSNGANAGKSATLEVLTSPNVQITENNLILTVYDVLWWAGTDMHSLDFSERMEYVKKFTGTSKRIRASQNTEIKSIPELVNAVRAMCDTRGSNGAIIKHPSYKYSLDGKTNMMLSYKNELTLDVKIIDRILEPLGDKSSYECAVVDKNGNDVYVGKTIRTPLVANTGDIVKVVFTSIIPYQDPDSQKKHFSIVHARIVEIRQDLIEPSTLDHTLNLVANMGIMTRDKPYPEMSGLNDSNTSNDACQCMKPKMSADDSIDIEFKVLEQTPTSNNGIPSYHLVLRHPTKVIDFNSKSNPLQNDSFTALHSKSKMNRWTTTGQISRSHPLNDTKTTPCRIDVIDTGTAKLNLTTDMAYEIKLNLDGEYFRGNMTAKRQGNSTDLWDLIIEQVIA